MQRAGIKALKTTLPAGPAGALVSIDPSTGEVRAMVASTDFRKTSFDLAWQAHRQLGSAMKPFALTAAVEQGANPATTFYDSQPLHLFLGQGAVPPYWDVRTFSNTYAGRINLVQATWQSDNTVYAQLALDVGAANIVRVAHRMGIRSPRPRTPSIVLGTEAVTPLEVADAYATFASEGVRHAPLAITRVVFPNGHVDTTAPRARRAIPPAPPMSWTRSCRATPASAPPPPCPIITPAWPRARPAPPPTAPTPGSAASTRAGMAVWMGYPQAEVPMPGVQGATYCVPIWGKYYAAVFGKRAIPDFAKPARMPVWVTWKGAHAVAGRAPRRRPRFHAHTHARRRSPRRRHADAHADDHHQRQPGAVTIRAATRPRRSSPAKSQ